MTSLHRPAALAPALLCVVALSSAAGCAAPLGLGRPATVIEPGHVRVSADVGMRVAGGATDEQAAASAFYGGHSGEGCGNGDPQDLCVDDATRRVFVRGAAAGLMSTPQTADSGLAVRYGLFPGVDAGVRLGTSAVRGELAWQFFGDPLNSSSSGLTALLGVGVSHQLETGRQPLQLLELSGVGRDDVDLFALLGYRHYRQAYLTLGGRYMASVLRADVVELVPGPDTDGDGVGEFVTADLPDTDVSGVGHHFGLVASAYAGYGAVFLGLEVAAGVDIFSIRALGEESTVTSSAIRPSIVLFFEI